jgi:D-sedoheptulose 7-phosphate isomerase
MPNNSNRNPDSLISGFKDHISLCADICNDLDLLNTILSVAECITSALKGENKILLFGCGGSAADAQHIAAEFINKLYILRKSLPALALTTDTSILTAIGNDSGFDNIFSRQIEGLSKVGDVVIGISTSGNSPSVCKGLSVAHEHQCITVFLTSTKVSGDLSGYDFVIKVPSHNTARIQEAHMVISHLICEIVEISLFYE